MRRKAVIAGLFIFVSTILTNFAYAAEKFGYIDLVRVLGEYSKAKDYEKELNNKEQTYTSDRGKKVNEIKQLQDKFDLLSDKEKETKKNEVETKINSLQDYDSQKQTDLRKEQHDKTGEVLKDIEDAVEQYAVKEGLTLVFDNRILIYQDKNMDITSKIIETLNKGYKK